MKKMKEIFSCLFITGAFALVINGFVNLPIAFVKGVNKKEDENY